MEDRKPPLVLASASQSRADMLRAAGLSFDTAPADIDEGAIKAAMSADDAEAEDIAMALARDKAGEISRRRPEAAVIGADQILRCEGELFDKATDVPAARRILQHLRGRRHELICAACVCRNGALAWRYLSVARLTMRDFSDAYLDWYLGQVGEAVLWSVGGYQIEGLGAQLFDQVDGDHFTILGLPLLPLLGRLRELGVIED
ncbi:MAG: Maf family protein [Alphaproteobacteria bacterium]|jgi:septum formation protein|nr:Maf family protein [Alphaproteobacteria bacterium]MDP6565041.1 Maf family protein [Alphaproteobacteria bacterium]MDP6815069.1 Maf family protein [Alphaproteobacteria bacterium]|tara:strand:+ start:120 stop:728 length:609 start_codon:yes stop_codon:yes gene_type:complete